MRAKSPGWGLNCWSEMVSETVRKPLPAADGGSSGELGEGDPGPWRFRLWTVTPAPLQTERTRRPVEILRWRADAPPGATAPPGDGRGTDMRAPNPLQSAFISVTRLALTAACNRFFSSSFRCNYNGKYNASSCCCKCPSFFLRQLRGKCDCSCIRVSIKCSKTENGSRGHGFSVKTSGREHFFLIEGETIAPWLR